MDCPVRQLGHISETATIWAVVIGWLAAVVIQYNTVSFIGKTKKVMSMVW